MNKLFLLLLITLFFFGCSSPLKKDINKMLDVKVEESIKNLQPKDLTQVMITSRLNYLLIPLFIGLFSGIFLVVSGMRMIGFSILLASVACIVVIVTMAVYLQLIAVIGVGAMVVGTYFLGKDVYDKRILQRDLVNSVEIVKRLVPAKDKKALKKDLNIAQSTYTQKIVKEIKNKKVFESGS